MRCGAALKDKIIFDEEKSYGQEFLVSSSDEDFICLSAVALAKAIIPVGKEISVTVVPADCFTPEDLPGDASVVAWRYPKIPLTDRIHKVQKSWTVTIK